MFESGVFKGVLVRLVVCVRALLRPASCERSCFCQKSFQLPNLVASVAHPTKEWHSCSLLSLNPHRHHLS